MRDKLWIPALIVAVAAVVAVTDRQANAQGTPHVAVELSRAQAADLSATIAAEVGKLVATADPLEYQLAAPIGSDVAKRMDGSLTLLAASWTEAPATDIPALNRDAGKSQTVTINNLEAVNKICVTWVPRAGAADCSTKVGTVTETCTGTPGGGEADYVFPGVPWQHVFSGDQCVFVRAVVDQSDWQFEDIAR